MTVQKYGDLIGSGKIVPGDPGSRVLARLEAGTMPPGQTKVPAADIATIKDWILQGAPNWDSASQGPPRTFVSEAQILQFIQSDLNMQNERSLPYLRYYSLVHLYNADVTDADLEQYRIGLSKLVNSLSRMPKIVRPFPINREGTLLRIDLRDFKWDDAIWKTIVSAYPYGVRSTGSEQIHYMTGAEVPYVRADWFVFQASTPPLYHDILRLPSTIKELETQNGVDLERDFREEHNFFRAGMSVSHVSNNNRIVERHDSVNGAYWRSYDFLGSKGENSISANPLTFKAAGGEIIFNLPNGLQAYLLADATGKRLDGKANPDIVADREGGIDVQVSNGRSCIGCHSRGMREAPDVVRSSVLNAPNFPNRDKVLAVYPDRAEFKKLLDADSARFEQAIIATGGQITTPDPVTELSKKYNKPLSAELAAAELGLQIGVFKQKIREDQALGNLGFGQLLEAGGVYQRDTWEGNFSELVRNLRLGDPLDHVLIRDFSGTAPQSVTKRPFIQCTEIDNRFIGYTSPERTPEKLQQFLSFLSGVYRRSSSGEEVNVTRINDSKYTVTYLGVAFTAEISMGSDDGATTRYRASFSYATGRGESAGSFELGCRQDKTPTIDLKLGKVRFQRRGPLEP